VHFPIVLIVFFVRTKIAEQQPLTTLHIQTILYLRHSAFQISKLSKSISGVHIRNVQSIFPFRFAASE
jgi:hypothetical protein